MLNLKPKIRSEVKQEKEQHQKKLLSTKYRKGLKLFALDPDKGVYQVPIEENKTFNLFDKRKTAKRKATINPKHPIVWALNFRNAERKLNA